MWDPGEYRKDGIRASTGKVGSRRVPERWDPGEYRRMVRESTIKVGSERVPEKWDQGEYWEGKILVITEKGRIWASTGNVGSG